MGKRIGFLQHCDQLVVRLAPDSVEGELQLLPRCGIPVHLLHSVLEVLQVLVVLFSEKTVAVFIPDARLGVFHPLKNSVHVQIRPGDVIDPRLHQGISFIIPFHTGKIPFVQCPRRGFPVFSRDLRLDFQVAPVNGVKVETKK
ncbi:hypothetical protein LJC33_08245 [Eubacteriales bacterium OttesenSCG-928-N13]|nr:hypothetical protein [Eubacteriales bacterium OttesenSCG-928-N13]